MAPHRRDGSLPRGTHAEKRGFETEVTGRPRRTPPRGVSKARWAVPARGRMPSDATLGGTSPLRQERTAGLATRKSACRDWRRGWESSDRPFVLGRNRYVLIEVLCGQRVGAFWFLRRLSSIPDRLPPVAARCHSECHSTAAIHQDGTPQSITALTKRRRQEPNADLALLRAEGDHRIHPHRAPCRHVTREDRDAHHYDWDN